MRESVGRAAQVTGARQEEHPTARDFVDFGNVKSHEMDCEIGDVLLVDSHAKNPVSNNPGDIFCPVS